MTKKPKPSRHPPKDHPLAWKSSLWPHVDLIRDMRRGRKTWLEIATELRKHKVTVSHRTVRNFFQRVTRKHAKLPLGFEKSPPSPAPKAPKPAHRPTNGDPLSVEAPITPGTDLFKKTTQRYRNP